MVAGQDEQRGVPLLRRAHRGPERGRQSFLPLVVHSHVDRQVDDHFPVLSLVASEDRQHLADSCAQRAPALPPQQRFPADRHQLLCATEPA